MIKAPVPASGVRFETAFINGILLLSFIVQANAIFHHGVYGQDFEIQQGWVHKAVDDPVHWLFASQDRTSPPLYHFLVSLVYRACSGIHWLEVTGLISACINVLSLRLLYATASRLITNLTLRLSLLMLVAFLPVTLVHTVVLAADSLSQLPFFAILYALVSLCLGKISPSRAFSYLAIASAFGFSTKFVAVSFIPAMLCAVPVICHAQVLSWRRGLTFLAIFLCLGSCLEYYWLTQKKSNVTDSFSPNMGGYKKPPEKINLRSLFIFRPGDAYLLNAPTYFLLLQNYPKAPQTLYDSNYFSFPGLSIFAIFSDHLNIFQVKGAAPYGTRTPENQQRMALAVKTGFVIGTAVLLAAILTFGINCYRALAQRQPEAAAVACIGLFSFAWLAFIMTLLPLATVGVLYGYWIPRLFIPTIWGLALLAFYGLGRLPLTGLRATLVRGVILALVVLQSGLHLSFLWPWNNY